MRSRSALPILLLSLSPPLHGQSPKPVDEKIVNGLIDNLHPTVGLFSTNGGECSATLIGCQTVLTAAHCGEVANAAVLCPSFYRADVIENPSRTDH